LGGLGGTSGGGRDGTQILGRRLVRKKDGRVAIGYYSQMPDCWIWSSLAALIRFFDFLITKTDNKQYALGFSLVSPSTVCGMHRCFIFYLSLTVKGNRLAFSITSLTGVPPKKKE
jgi:hypothetical protein